MDVSFVDPPKTRVLACPACGSAFIRKYQVIVRDENVRIGFRCEACHHMNHLELNWDVGTRISWVGPVTPHRKSNWQCRYDDIPRIVSAARAKIEAEKNC